MELTPVKRKSLSDATKDYLLEYIRGVDSEQTTKIPSEAELAEHLSVSRITVRKALNDLENSGLILRIHGKGTFVNPNAMRINLNLNPGQDFNQLISGSGYTCTLKLLDYTEKSADTTVANKLAVSPDTEFIRIRRQFYADDIPAIFCADYVPAPYLGEHIDDEKLCKSTLTIIRENAGMACVRDSFTIRTCSRDEMAALIGRKDLMKCSSALMLESVNYDQNNMPVFYCQVLYDTNVICFNMMRRLDVKS